MATMITRRSFLTKVGMFGGLLAGGTVIAACGGGSATQAPAAKTEGGAVTLEIASKGEELLYDKDKLEAPAGSKITLKFKNNSSALMHNWVLVKAGTGDAVAADGLTAGEAKGYLKENDNRVIAHTGMVKAGESASITFDAPAAGAYPYVCTFPGHNVLMKGTLTIK
jgi:azurin